MILGKVKGMVVSTRKNELLVGNKFLIIKPLDKNNKAEFVAIDNVGAGIGETVIIATGSAARVGCGMANAPVDAAVVGIVDEGQAIIED